jgi:hypothetical protein
MKALNVARIALFVDHGGGRGRIAVTARRQRLQLRGRRTAICYVLMIYADGHMVGSALSYYM